LPIDSADGPSFHSATESANGMTASAFQYGL
jgi:hypothetical protein